MSKVILMDTSGVFVPTVKVWGGLKQKQVENGFPSFILPAHCMYFNSLLSSLSKIGVDKDDIVIMAGEGHSWRKDYLACLSEDTDILTENGWINIKDFVEGKSNLEVATLNISQNKVEYYKPCNWFKYKYKGEMYKLGGRGHALDILMTPNHKHLCKKHHEKEFSLKTLDHIKNNSEIQSYRGFPWNKKNTRRYFTIPKGKSISSNIRGRNKFTYIVEYPSRKIPINTWLKFLGWYLSEGCLKNGRCSGNTKKYCVSISQSKNINPIYFKEIYDLLSSEMGYKVSISTRKNVKNLIISDVQLANYLSQFGKAYNKFIPRKLLNSLNKKQCKLLLNTLVKGDGSFRGKAFSYTTVSKRLLDDIQELALKAGYAVTYSKPKKHNFYCISASLEKTPRTKKQIYKNQNMDVYCIDVPNHTFFIRRKGKTCWTGNSYKAQRQGLRDKDTFIDWPYQYSQLNKLHSQLEKATNWHFVRVADGLEADDVIAIGCRYFSDKKVIVVTGDKDLYQLAFYENVSIYTLNKKVKGTKGCYITVKSPLKIISEKVRTGDKGDNIIPEQNEVQEDRDLREYIVTLLTLPEDIEKKGRDAFDNALKEKKVLNLKELPPFTNVQDKFLKIYDKDKIITPEYCTNLTQKREDKKKKELKLKREQVKLEKLKEKEQENGK
ncbi:MAG: hypothetical protein M0R03_08855 [Novosphingobium sp.]|nr:hypothetical protein [Novosphingobium sp.]